MDQVVGSNGSGDRVEAKELRLGLVKFVPTILGKALVAAPFGKLKPPLSGPRILGWIHEALQTMDATGTPGRTLMPSDHPLDLFVTTTDVDGRRRRVPVDDPPS